MHQFTAITTRLMASGLKVKELAEQGQIANPNRMRLRLCRIGTSCTNCGGAAWIRDCSQKKPDAGCKARRSISPETRALKAHLQASLPAWMARYVSF